MSNQTSTTEAREFTREDLTAARQAFDLLRDFETFILNRFAVVTREREMRDVRGRVVEPIEGDPRRQNGNWSSWHVDARWLTSGTVDAEEPFVEVYMTTADDRGPSTTHPKVQFGLDLLFGDTQRTEEYEEFLRLKAIFEPSQG